MNADAPTKTRTLHVRPENHREVARLALETGRSKQEIANEAIEIGVASLKSTIMPVAVAS